MSVSIEDVLTLLPEMFPELQQVPLANISPLPDNPGPPPSEEVILSLMESIRENGLQNPLKLKPNRNKPLVDGVRLHPENPRTTLEGRPWRVEDFNYWPFSGNRRSVALMRLGWEKTPSFITNPNEEDTVIKGRIDNKVEPRGWWADYQDVERIIKANPHQTQRQIKVKLGLDDVRVNWAIKLLPLLNAEARELIARNPSNSNKGIWGISESALYQLAALGPGTGLKSGVKKTGEAPQALWPYPPVPAETQDKVKRTLAVAIDQELTEAGVKALVGWVQEGHKPEEYGSESQEAVTPSPNRRENPTPEYKQIPTQLVRLNKLDSSHKAYLSADIERKALSMKKLGFAKEIIVRTLSDEEKTADPQHDFELIDGVLVLEAAKKIDWPSLQAFVYEINKSEATRLWFGIMGGSQVQTWMEVFMGMENILRDDPKITVTDLAVKFEQDPELAEEVFPVMRLLNQSARIAIIKCILKCYEGRVDIGGYRFSQWLLIPLKRLEKISKDLSETQKVVEKVVNVAIENEMGETEIEELVDWVWDGNEPEEFYVKEA